MLIIKAIVAVLLLGYLYEEILRLSLEKAQFSRKYSVLGSLILNISFGGGGVIR
jgi:hypothetical protein